jgi:hypothetical protein
MCSIPLAGKHDAAVYCTATALLPAPARGRTASRPGAATANARATQRLDPHGHSSERAGSVVASRTLSRRAHVAWSA